MAAPRVAVVGGGLAGLMTTIKLAEAGVPVDLFSIVPVKRSHSVCAQGGINGAVNVKGENDSPEVHFFDTCRGGDFLAHQPPVKGMCYAAPGIIYLFDRMGVTFNRTPEGLLDFRRFGGTMHHRTAFAGATTGQQLLYALDEQVRRHEAGGLVTKYEGWEFVGTARDDGGRCVGLVALDLRSMKPRAFAAGAVVMATGGPGLMFGRSTNSIINSGSAAAAAYMDGADYGNGEFIQVHPTAIPGMDKLRLMSESARGEGGRVWVPRKKGDERPPKSIPESERWYFLEERYPKYQNLVPRDVASREIHNVCVDMGLGVGGGMVVYLDLTHVPRETLKKKLEGILEIYEKFTGEDPCEQPMKIYPAVHYSMGGLWVDYERTSDGFLNLASPRNQRTSVDGLYAVGECDYQYHGANRLGANSLLSCIYAGMIGGPSMISYAKNNMQAKGDVPSSLLDGAKKQWQERFDRIYKMDGSENPYVIGQQMGELMVKSATVVKVNSQIDQALVGIAEMKERWKKCNVLDTGRTVNQSATYVNQLWNMLEIAHLILKASRLRDESRGSHYKPEFVLPKVKEGLKPQQDPEFMAAWKARNDKWLKNSMGTWTPDGPKVEFKELESLKNPILAPEPRHYD